MFVSCLYFGIGSGRSAVMFISCLYFGIGLGGQQ